MKNYDKVILDHYKQVASESGDSSLSTMSHEYIRDSETSAILKFLKYLSDNEKVSSSATIADVGCGNGYTLECINNAFPEFNLFGYEYTPELREIAVKRFGNKSNVKVMPADIRDVNTLVSDQIDVLLCQRVLINLMDIEDQKKAVENLVQVVKTNGYLFFIETFQFGLDNLNEARKEFDLEPLPPAHHNMNLPSDFFETFSTIKEITVPDINKNFLSTYYYVSRVIHPLFLEDRPLKRNSHFVKFLTSSLSENLFCDFSPLKIRIFQKK